MLRSLTGAVFLIGTTASAHPHSDIDQQLLITLGVDDAALTYVIVPSIGSGPDFVSMIDTDTDGTISPAEADQFANAIAAATTILADDQTVELYDVFAIMPPVENIMSATAPITVKATVEMPFATSGIHSVGVDIAFDAMSHDWFIQPFYRSDLIDLTGTPELMRQNDTSAISITAQTP
ncbi:hypothetical protein [Marivivens niveibacter]|nr:hypothetical protein [Marivivens niveibacter]